MVDSLRRALLSEKKLDVNDAGLGAVAMQGGKASKKVSKFG